MTRQEASEHRALQMHAMREQGNTYEQIGNFFKMSKQGAFDLMKVHPLPEGKTVNDMRFKAYLWIQGVEVCLGHYRTEKTALLVGTAVQQIVDLAETD